jgi:hypothetical protein
LTYNGQLYEVMYAYRTEHCPSEWLYYLEEREHLQRQQSALQCLAEAVGAGAGVQRTVSGVFSTEEDAQAYFADVYRAADSVLVRNQALVRSAAVVSSGAVEPACEENRHAS